MTAAAVAAIGLHAKAAAPEHTRRNDVLGIV
jgi:hypothetical protein